MQKHSTEVTVISVFQERESDSSDSSPWFSALQFIQGGDRKEQPGLDPGRAKVRFLWVREWVGWVCVVGCVWLGVWVVGCLGLWVWVGWLVG